MTIFSPRMYADDCFTSLLAVHTKFVSKNVLHPKCTTMIDLHPSLIYTPSLQPRLFHIHDLHPKFTPWICSQDCFTHPIWPISKTILHARFTSMIIALHPKCAMTVSYPWVLCTQNLHPGLFTLQIIICCRWLWQSYLADTDLYIIIKIFGRHRHILYAY